MKTISIQKIFIFSFALCLISMSNTIFGQKLEVNSYPTLHAWCRNTIECKNDSCYIQIKIFNPKDTINIIWTETNIVPLKSCITIFKYFDDETALKDTIIAGFDGNYVFGKYENNTDLKQFSFWSPSKGTNEYEFYIEYLKVLKKTMRSRNTKKYIKVLKRYT